MTQTAAQVIDALDRGATTLELDDLSEAVTIRSRSNLKITGRVRPATIATKETPIIRLVGCSDIEFDGLDIEGLPSAAGFDGRGIGIEKSTGVAIRNGRFNKLYRAAVADDSRELLFTRNDLTLIQSDGFQGSQIDGVEVSENRATEPCPFVNAANTGDHPDLIAQFFSVPKQRGCSGVRVLNNMMIGRVKQPAQGILVKTEGGGRHRDVQVIGNVLINTMANAIFLAKCDGGAVRDNLVAHHQGLSVLGVSVTPHIRIDDCPGVEVGGNTAPSWMFPKWVKTAPAGNSIAKLDPDHLIAMWEAQFRPTFAQQMGDAMAAFDIWLAEGAKVRTQLAALRV